MHQCHRVICVQKETYNYDGVLALVFLVHSEVLGPFYVLLLHLQVKSCPIHPILLPELDLPRLYGLHLHIQLRFDLPLRLQPIFPLPRLLLIPPLNDLCVPLLGHLILFCLSLRFDAVLYNSECLVHFLHFTPTLTRLHELPTLAHRMLLLHLPIVFKHAPVHHEFHVPPQQSRPLFHVRVLVQDLSELHLLEPSLLLLSIESLSLFHVFKSCKECPLVEVGGLLVYGAEGGHVH